MDVTYDTATPYNAAYVLSKAEVHVASLSEVHAGRLILCVYRFGIYRAEFG